MRIKTWAIVLLCAAVPGIDGCGGGSSSAPVVVSGIRVQVQQRIEGGPFFLTPRPPTIRPLPGATVVVQLASTGRPVARKQSDHDGLCTFRLEPNTYLVAPLQPDPLASGIPPAPQRVTVRSGRVESVTMTYLLLAP